MADLSGEGIAQYARRAVGASINNRRNIANCAQEVAQEAQLPKHLREPFSTLVSNLYFAINTRHASALARC